jgi:hypothetical protein
VRVGGDRIARGRVRSRDARGEWRGGGERARWVSGSSWKGAKFDIVLFFFAWACLCCDAAAAVVVTRGSMFGVVGLRKREGAAGR